MKASFNRDDLLGCLRRVQGTVQNNNVNPILSHVLLKVEKGEAENSGLTVIAADQEMQMTCFCPIKAEGGLNATVPARKLQDILQQLEPAAEVNVEFSPRDKKAVLKSGKARFQLMMLNAEDFPLRSPPEKATKFSKPVPAEKLVTVLKHVHYAAAKQSHRMNLNGILLETAASGLQLVATDGHRMAMEILSEVKSKSEIQAILPRKAVGELIRNLEEEEKVEVLLSDRAACFKTEQFELISNIIDETFPDYNSVIPRNNEKVATVDRRAFLSCLQKVTVLSERDSTVVLKFAKGSLAMNCTNRDSETADDAIPVQYQGEEMEIGFNHSFLEEMLSAVEIDVMTLNMAEPSGSVLVEPADKELLFKYIVMPIRL